LLQIFESVPNRSLVYFLAAFKSSREGKLAGLVSSAFREGPVGQIHLRRIYPALAKTLLAGRRVDFASCLGWLRNRRKSSTITGGAFDFRRYNF
jgi:hypothetical protein